MSDIDWDKIKIDWDKLKAEYEKNPREFLRGKVIEDLAQIYREEIEFIKVRIRNLEEDLEDEKRAASQYFQMHVQDHKELLAVQAELKIAKESVVAERELKAALQKDLERVNILKRGAENDANPKPNPDDIIIKLNLDTTEIQGLINRLQIALQPRL